jgi:hypothetical protein
MSASLIPCPECARHVRANESGCPFCGQALPSDLARAPLPLPPPSGLSRGSRFLYAKLGLKALAGAVAGASMLACSDETTIAAYGIACDPAIDDGCGINFDAGPDVVFADAKVSGDGGVGKDGSSGGDAGDAGDATMSATDATDDGSASDGASTTDAAGSDADAKSD